MHSVRLGSKLRISMIFSAPSGGSSVSFSVFGSQTPIGISSWPFAARLISGLHYAYMSQLDKKLSNKLNISVYIQRMGTISV